MTAKNRLFYGDNLDVLRRYIREESVDLVYLDPPFNSNADYNVLFAEKTGTKAAAQIKAFEDTWQWDEAAAAAFHEVVEAGGDVAQALIAFRTFLGESDMLAYLAMMAPRLIELRRVLKPTGSIYLHCDLTASHYLKMLMDAVFGPAQFKNEIIWKRTAGRSDSHRWNHIHDCVLFYGKSDTITWNPQFTPYDDAYVDNFYRQTDESGRRFMSDNLTAAGTRGGTSGKPWKGIDPTDKGRHWAIPGAALEGLSVDDEASVQDKLDALEAANRIVWPDKQGGTPRFRRYLDEMPGVAIQSIITDIPPIPAHAAERLGYPTQKPLALLERIVKASSNEGDVVLDPFCGCGTTVDAAQKLKRRWIGIDITHLAIGLIKKRLSDTYGESIKDTYEVIGEPTSIDDAKNLAASDPFQFQTWALGLVGARPAGSAQVKKGRDRGVDGRIYFHDGSDATRNIVLSVKAGHTGPDHVRDLRGTVEREKASIGVLITMEEPTREMRKEAATGEYYDSDWGQHPRIQLLTIADLLGGKTISRPPDRQTGATFKKAPKAEADIGEAFSLGWGKGATTSKPKRRR